MMPAMRAVPVVRVRAVDGRHVARLRPALALALLLAVVVGRAWTTRDQLIVGGDVLLIHYPLFVLWRDALAAGAFPWWNPYTFSGLPAFADPHTGYLYPPQVLLSWLPPIVAINWAVGLHVLLAGLTMAWFARQLGASPEGQVLSGAAYALGSAMTARLHAGHLSFLEANAWLPLATGLAMHIGARRNVVYLALVVAVMALAGQPELLIFSVWWLPLWAGGSALHTAPAVGFRSAVLAVGRALVRAWLGLALGLALAAAQLLPTLLFAETASRSAGMAWGFLTESSLPPWHVLGVFAPGVFGDPGHPYWPGPSYEWHERLLYVGVVPLLAAAWVPKQWRPLCWGAAALAIALAFGRYAPWYAWAQALPGYPSFRVPSKHLSLAALALALAAGLGLEHFRGWRAALTAVLLAGLLAVGSVSFEVWFPALAPRLGAADALALAPTDTSALAALAAPTLRVASLLALGGALAALLPGAWARRALLVLALLDLTLVLQPFRLMSVDPNSIVAQADAIRPYPRAAVVGSGGSNLANYGPVVHVVQPAGYTSLFSGQYAALMTGNLDQSVAIDINRVDNPALGVVGYPIAFQLDSKRLSVIAPSAPTAWVARCAWPGGTAEVRVPDFPRQACVTLADAVERQQPQPAGQATVVAEGNSWRTVQADGPGWLVTTEPWYPGWTAQLDNAAQPVDVVDGALVGVRLPPGPHTVQLRYLPAGIQPGVALSVAAAFALLVLGWRPRWLRP
jgi:Bacterial membrane protein YfhO